MRSRWGSWVAGQIWGRQIRGRKLRGQVWGCRLRDKVLGRCRFGGQIGRCKFGDSGPGNRHGEGLGYRQGKQFGGASLGIQA